MSGEPNRGKSVGRPLRMLNALMKGEQLDANTASKKYGVQRAMALRDLQTLAKNISGVECDERSKSHTFTFKAAVSSAPRARPPLGAAIAASLGASFAPLFTGTRYKSDLEKLRRDIVTRFGRREKDFAAVSRKFFAICGHEEVLEEQAGILDDAIEGLLSQRVLDVDYQKFDGSEERLQIRPYTLAVYDSHLYVVGVDVSQGEPKPIHPYRFARIRKLEVGDVCFKYPAPTEYNPSVLFHDSFGVWLSDPQPCRVRIRLTEYWAVYAQHHQWHHSQQLSKRSDGSVELALRVRPCPELEQWVLRFGEHAEVLEPAEFREKIAKRLTAAAIRYATPGPVARKAERARGLGVSAASGSIKRQAKAATTRSAGAHATRKTRSGP